MVSHNVAHPRARTPWAHSRPPDMCPPSGKLWRAPPRVLGQAISGASCLLGQAHLRALPPGTFSSGERGEQAGAQYPSDPIFSIRRAPPQALFARTPPRAHSPRGSEENGPAHSAPSDHIFSVSALACTPIRIRSPRGGEEKGPSPSGTLSSGARAHTLPLGPVLVGGARRTDRRTVPLRPYLLGQAHSRALPLGPVLLRGARRTGPHTVPLRPYLLGQAPPPH